MFANADEIRAALKERLQRGDLINKSDDEIVQVLRAEAIDVPQKIRSSEVAEALFIDRTIVRMRVAMEAPASAARLKEAIALVFAAISNRESIINLTDPLILETVNEALDDIYTLAPTLVPARVRQRLAGLMFRSTPKWPPELDRINLINARSK